MYNYEEGSWEEVKLREHRLSGATFQATCFFPKK
jgi:hypothetical protein